MISIISSTTRSFRVVATMAALAIAPLATYAAADTDNVLAAVKFPPLKTFSDKLMGVARQVMPGQEVEMYPMLFLGAYGYPNYPGVSDKDPVTMFLFDSEVEGNKPFVILSKISADSPLRNALTAKSGGGNPMALGMSIEDRDGWTLISNDPANFKHVTDVAALAKLAGEVEDFDITTRFYIGPDKMAEWVDEMKAKARDEHVKAGGAATDEALAQKERYIDFIATIGENLEFFDFGIDINNSAIGLGTALQAIKGTPEYAMLSAKSGGDVPVAQFVEAAAALVYSSSVDVDAVETYYNVLHDRAMKIATKEGQKILEEAAQANKEYFAMMGNGSAGAMDFMDDKALTQTVSSGKMDNDKVVELAKLYYDKLIPQVMSHLEFLDVGSDNAAEFEIKPGVAKLDGKSVNEVISRIKTPDPVSAANPNAAPTSSIKEESSFFAIVDGNLVSASNQDLLATLVKAVESGKAVDNNVGSKITLADGEAMAYQFSFEPLITWMTSSFPMQSETAKQALKSIQSESLDPASGKVTLNSGKAKATFAAPLSSIIKLTEARRKIEQAEIEAQTFGPGN
ncbi:MAG: hypothetical protein ACQKBV_12290 [Puniceicoccales bacterium]